MVNLQGEEVKEMKHISITEAAAAIGKSPQTLRVMMQYDAEGKSPVRLVPFGTACKLPGSRKWNYTIYEEKFKEYVGG